MGYLITTLLGVAAGIFSTFMALEPKRRRLNEQAVRIHKQAREAEEARIALHEDRKQLDALNARLQTMRIELEARVVSIKELEQESVILKRDLKNLDTQIWKNQLDVQRQRQLHEAIDKKVEEVGSRYLKDTVKWVGSSVTANNFSSCKQRLQRAIEECREIGLAVPSDDEARYHANLKVEYEKLVRAAFEREEQARIRAQIREEQKREREIQRELDRLTREQETLQAALNRALAETKDEHSAIVEELRAKLADAEARAQRAISQAQITKAGYIYVISNLGSFGDGVFKIGMTRRLEPLDRVRELGDASVPFPFDVHMMISADDAPALESTLHRALHKSRLNKVNPRKEFFRATIDEIRQIVEENHGQVDYVADPEALQYREGLTISDEDVEYIEHVFEEIEEEVHGGEVYDAD